MITYLFRIFFEQIKRKKKINPYYVQDLNAINFSISELKRAGICDDEVLTSFVSNIEPYIKFGKYSQDSYFAARNISISSGLKFNILLKEYYKKAFPSNIQLSSQAGVIANALIDDGYFVLNTTNGAKELANYYLKKMAILPVVREIDERLGDLSYFYKNPIPGAIRYNFREQDLEILPFLSAIESAGILDAIESYIGKPILRNICAWVSTQPIHSTKKDLDIAAQLFHRDLDNPGGWVKVFIYLTDVTSDNGPHVFSAKSHRVSPPQTLKRDGRFSDDEVEKTFEKSKVLCGEAGTIIVADTLGFHKGLPIINGSRKILQLEFVSSLWGANTPQATNFDFRLKELEAYEDRFKYRFIRDSLGG